MFLDIFRRPNPVHKEVRHVVATRSESRKAANKRASVLAQLAVYVATTSPEQRKAETEAAFRRVKAGRGN